MVADGKLGVGDGVAMLRRVVYSVLNALYPDTMMPIPPCRHDWRFEMYNSNWNKSRWYCEDCWARQYRFGLGHKGWVVIEEDHAGWRISPPRVMKVHCN
jgi:hypothetical protein